MSYALFITRNDIIKNSPLQGAIDADALLPFVRTAQDKYLKNLLGTVLFEYLQLDCEPAKNTFEALLSIPFDKYRFAVITYEHDWYTDDKTYRDKSRKYLQMMGYQLVVSNISLDYKSPFEDWCSCIT